VYALTTTLLSFSFTRSHGFPFLCFGWCLYFELQLLDRIVSINITANIDISELVLSCLGVFVFLLVLSLVLSTYCLALPHLALSCALICLALSYLALCSCLILAVLSFYPTKNTFVSKSHIPRYPQIQRNVCYHCFNFAPD
jgi:hypothetical protein